MLLSLAYNSNKYADHTITCTLTNFLVLLLHIHKIKYNNRDMDMYLVWSILSESRPLQHQCHPKSHHKLCPRLHSDTHPHDLHAHLDHQQVSAPSLLNRLYSNVNMAMTT